MYVYIRTGRGIFLERYFLLNNNNKSAKSVHKLTYISIFFRAVILLLRPGSFNYYIIYKPARRLKRAKKFPFSPIYIYKYKDVPPIIFNIFGNARTGNENIELNKKKKYFYLILLSDFSYRPPAFALLNERGRRTAGPREGFCPALHQRDLFIYKSKVEKMFGF